jgi:hypothetical protein
MKPIELVAVAFFAVWIVAGLSFWLLMRRAKTAAAKSATHRRLVFASGGLFLAFVCALVAAGFPSEALFMAVPGVALITFLNLRLTNFCPKCTRMTQNTSTPWRRLEFCPYCGAGFSAEPSDQARGAAPRD